MTTNQTIGFPRELSDELGELIAEKARVCGGGAFDIWEAICEKFGTPAAQPRGDSVTIEAVAVTRDNADGGLRLEWLLEGGISQMEFAGMVLFAIPEANDLCDEDGSAEVYLTPPQAEQPAPVAVVLPERLQQVLKFLDGAENLDGHWFGEPHPSGRSYWWRNELRKALAETNLFAIQQ